MVVPTSWEGPKSSVRRDGPLRGVIHGMGWAFIMAQPSFGSPVT